MEWIKTEYKLPDAGDIFYACLKHCTTGKKVYACLERVKSNDYDFEIAWEHSQLSHDWDVIAWAEMPKYEEKAK